MVTQVNGSVRYSEFINLLILYGIWAANRNFKHKMLGAYFRAIAAVTI